MSLKSDIENIFKKNTGYAEPEHAINQAESLNSLSVDLYTDSKRFVYELLQNADDSAVEGKPVKVGVRLFENYLVVAHNGKPFDSRDLRGICGVSDGTKKNLVEKTGYKGIGFKAVFGQSEKVVIYTNNEFFRFDSGFCFRWNNSWGENQQKWEEENDRKFSYPWQIIPIYTDAEEISDNIKAFLNEEDWKVATVVLLSKNKNEVKNAIDELSSDVNMYLFLKNIEELDFNLGSSNIVTLHRENSNTVEIKQNGIIKSSWLLKGIKLEVPDEIKEKLKEEKNVPEKLLKVNETELTFAAKIDSDGIRMLDDNEGRLYSYLPTEETKYSIPVLVNGSFVIGANRETLHECSHWNKWLFENLPLEIVKWIAELVVSRFGDQAYELLPNKIMIQDTLASKYRKGLQSAFETIPFIKSKQDKLLKINQAIIDFTSFSKKVFIGEKTIKEYIVNRENSSTIYESPFLPFTKFNKKIKEIGVAAFEWRDVSILLKTDEFLNNQTSSNNVELIKYFKQLCDAEKTKSVTKELVKKWSFILDHKGKLNFPNNIYFPTPNDENWNDPHNEISFLNGDIQNFLLQHPETRTWLEKLGVIEKTDLSYLRKTVIANASTYISQENAVKTILNIYNLYVKQEIGKEELCELSELKLLTEKGSLIPAKNCYFSDVYSPRLKLQSTLSDDIYVSSNYLTNISERDEFRRFFKMMGVKEGIAILSYDKMNIDCLITDYQFESDFFDEDDKFFKPFLRTFKVEEYKNLATLIFLQYTKELNFSKLFWSDVIKNINLEEVTASTIGFWGFPGRKGRLQGDTLENYLKWYINNINCIPTLNKTTQKVKEVFINSEEILQLSGNYLPVFDGEELSQDWKSFFKFKTTLKLSDHLMLLKEIASDVKGNNEVKNENTYRIQSIYKILLDQCSNWDSEELAEVKEWSATRCLLSTKNEFEKCNTLKYFIDGNEFIFQDQFKFLSLSAENNGHPSLIEFLNAFNIKILKQSDFKLEHSRVDICLSLITHLKKIIPYFILWIENEVYDNRTKESLSELQTKVSELNIFQADQLKINYEEIGFTKSVNVHFNDSDLYVTYPWNKNSVFLKLPEVLCRYFSLLGHDKKLDFLLRSTNEEIRDYFDQENIDFINKINDIREGDITSDTDIEVDDTLIGDFFHQSKSDYNSLKYAEKIIIRATSNILKFLSTLQEYDCTNASRIANNIIGGIIKNGNEITVVTRPSDGGEVLPYYTSEYDVLEYVDAEFWFEDGVNTPKQITLGYILKKTRINRIPVDNIDISTSDLVGLVHNKKSETLDFNAVPFVPEKVAMIVSSFANTNGGTLIFGINETSSNSNEIVGLSKDFVVTQIINKALTLLSPSPIVTYNWVDYEEKSIFVIETEKSESEILFSDRKYIREDTNTKIENETLQEAITINKPEYSKTIAIIIGIENYHPANEINPVKYANNDVSDFKQMLINDMHVAEDDIIVFQNADAIKSSIEYNLKSLFHSLNENERLVFYYVGHGFHNGVSNFLTTYDTHKSNISETGISLRTILLDPLRKSKCKTALIFIDACAQSFQDPFARSQISNIDDQEFIHLLHEFPYYGTFLSCHPKQKSYSSDNLENGIWTYHLIEALKGNVPEIIKGKYITDINMKEYLSESVYKYTKEELNKDQNPKAILDSGNENVILVLEEQVK